MLTDINNLKVDVSNIIIPDLSAYSSISYVDQSISNLLNGADPAYDTLLELQNLLQNNDISLNTIMSELSIKQNIIDSNNRLDALNIGSGIISNSEFNFLNGVSSNIQTQLNNKIESGDAITFSNNISFNSNITSKKITEINSVITITSNICSCDYNNSAVFVCSGQTANFRCDINNLVITTNKSYTITLLINTSTNKFYANTMRINGVSRTMLFMGGSSNIDLSSSNFCLQSITCIFTDSNSIPHVVISSVIPIY
jgi:hypothetical protein